MYIVIVVQYSLLLLHLYMIDCLVYLRVYLFCILLFNNAMLSLFHFLLSSPFSLRYPVSIRLVLIDFLDTSLFTLFNIPNIVLSLTHMPKPSSCVIFSSSCAYSILCCLFFKDYSLMNFVFLQS